MSEKYIDLAPQIASLHDQPLGTMRVALGLLDEFASDHPDQVPGRTITAGEVGRNAHLIRSVPIAGMVETPTIIDFLESLGFTVVPDPEPEPDPEDVRRLGEALEEAASTGWVMWSELARKAMKHRVKAPGGDDEH